MDEVSSRREVSKKETVRPSSPCSVLLMNGFDWASAAISPKDDEIDNAAISDKLNSLMHHRGKALIIKSD